MSGHTKKRRTDNVVELRFVGPATNRNEAIMALKALDFENVSDSVPWEEVFPEYSLDQYPGAVLRGSRAKEGITQKQLESISGIKQTHISAMENGKRQIGTSTAKKLGKALNISYKAFL